jgi:hypothetical protein
VRLKVNLKSILGQTVDDEEILDAIAQKALDIIKERTADGKDVRGRAFKPYSESYMASDAFKGFGKSKTPDLTLSGDMLGLMDVVKVTPSGFELGWDDETETAKAFNHITGDTVPKRDFFDLKKSEQEDLRRFAEKLIGKSKG